MERLAYEAARAGVRLVVFPELFLTGATFAAPLWRLAPTPDDAIERRVAALAQATGLHIVVGTAERRDDNLYNTALLAAPGRPLERYTKMHLFAADAFCLNLGVRPGDLAVAFTALDDYDKLLYRLWASPALRELWGLCPPLLPSTLSALVGPAHRVPAIRRIAAGSTWFANHPSFEARLRRLGEIAEA